MRVKNILKSITFLIMLFAILFLLSKWLHVEDNNIKFLVSDTPANRIIHEKENSLDVIFVGDSVCQAGFSPMLMWEKYGFTSYNCGSSGQYLYETYDYLDKVFMIQSPKVVVLETDTLHRFATLEQYALIRMSYDVPLVNDHNNWKDKADEVFNYSHNQATVDNYQDIADPMKGYVYQSVVDPVTDAGDYMASSNMKAPIALSNRIIMQGIKRLCEENGAKLILVSVPSYKNCNNGKRKAIVKLADSLNVELYDYNVGELKEQINLDWNTDTRDCGDHLSYDGAVKLCENVGNVISNEEGIEDRRQQTNYDYWNEALLDYHNRLGR